MTKINSKHISTVTTVEILQSSDEKVVKMFAPKISSNFPNFAYSFRPVYYVSRAFGLMPFSIIYNSNREPNNSKVTVYDCLWLMVSVCIYLMLGFFRYRNLVLPEGASTTSHILILGDSVVLILSLTFAGQFVIMDFFNRFKLVDVLKKIIVFDNEVSHQSNSNAIFIQHDFQHFSFSLQIARLGVSFDFRSEYIRSWLYCVVPMLVNVIFVTLSYLTIKPNLQNQPTTEPILFFGTYVMCNEIMILTIVSFISLLCNIYKRFLTLNSMLRFEVSSFHCFFVYCKISKVQHLCLFGIENDF